MFILRKQSIEAQIVCNTSIKIQSFFFFKYFAKIFLRMDFLHIENRIKCSEKMYWCTYLSSKVKLVPKVFIHRTINFNHLHFDNDTNLYRSTEVIFIVWGIRNSGQKFAFQEHKNSIVRNFISVLIHHVSFQLSRYLSIFLSIQY